MIIKNPNLSTSVSICLKTFTDHLKTDLNISPTVEYAHSTVKGEIITTIVIALGTNILANTVYDLLKYSINKHLSHLSDEDCVFIDGVKTFLNKIISDDKTQNSLNNNDKKS